MSVRCLEPRKYIISGYRLLRAEERYVSGLVGGASNDRDSTYLGGFSYRRKNCEWPNSKAKSLNAREGCKRDSRTTFNAFENEPRDPQISAVFPVTSFRAAK